MWKMLKISKFNSFEVVQTTKPHNPKPKLWKFVAKMWKNTQKSEEFLPETLDNGLKICNNKG